METIYAIPGLGTNKELYRNISVPNYELKVLDWPQPEKNFSLKKYADKFIDQIDQSKPVNLLGVSFGGMLCSEIAEVIPVNKVFLVSSCKNSSEFPALLKMLRFFPAYRLIPDSVIRSIAKTKRKFIGFEKSFEPVFIEMIGQMPPQYFSCCINYIITWDRKHNNAQVIQIHGTSDKLLKHYHLKNFHEIKNGTHGMVVSNASEINQILNKELNG